MRRDMLRLLVAVLLVATPALAGMAGGSPTPTFLSGALPGLSPMAAGGGEVLLDLAVDRSGVVTGVTTLRATAGYTAPLSEAVKGWRFTSAPQMPKGDEAHVLVIGVFRPPTMRGPAAGAVPEDVGKPTPGLPYPTQLTEPPLPPNLWSGSVVLVELKVDRSGAVTEARVVKSSPANGGEAGSAAVGAAKSWSFRPGRANGGAATTVAYAVVGFPEPVIVGAQENPR